MANDLTTSAVERQNILNNPFALSEIQKSIGIRGIEYNGEFVLLKEQVAEFFEVTPRTINNYLAANEAELRGNGYDILRGKSLQALRLLLQTEFGHETDFMTKTTTLGVFSFRAFRRREKDEPTGI